MSDKATGQLSKAILFSAGAVMVGGLFVALSKTGNLDRPAPTITPVPMENQILPHMPCVKVIVLPAGPVYYAEKATQKSSTQVVLQLNQWRTITVTSERGFILDPNPPICLSYNP